MTNLLKNLIYNVILSTTIYMSLFNFSAFSQTPGLRKTADQQVEEAVQREISSLKKTEKFSSDLAERQALLFPMAFVKKMQVSEEYTDIEIDSNKLRGFLSFSANLFHRDQPSERRSLCILQRVKSDCLWCRKESEKFKKGLSDFFSTRGFLVQFQDGVEEPSLNLEGESDWESSLQSDSTKTCSFIFFLEHSGLSEVAVNVGGTSHLKTAFIFKGDTGKTIKASSQIEIARTQLESSKPDEIAVLTAANSVAQVSSRASELGIGILNEGNKEEKILQIEGSVSSWSYGAVMAVCDRIRELNPGLIIKERKLSFGHAEFFLSGESFETMRKKIIAEVAQFGGIGGVSAEITPTVSQNTVAVQFKNGTSR